MKGSKKTGVAIPALIVLALAIVGYGFLIGSVAQGGYYVWAVVIAGAAVLGAGITLLASGKPGMHRVRARITNAERVIVNGYRLAHASRNVGGGARWARATGIVSGVIVKVANDDACRHRVAVDVGINDKPTHRVFREVAIEPGATAYVAIPLSTRLQLEDITSLSIELRRVS